MAWVITEPCVNEKIAKCKEICPEDCIETDDNSNQYFINPDKCTNCGLCDLSCPVGAIFEESTVPIQWKKYIEINKSYFM